MAPSSLTPDKWEDPRLLHVSTPADPWVEVRRLSDLFDAPALPASHLGRQVAWAEYALTSMAARAAVRPLTLADVATVIEAYAGRVTKAQGQVQADPWLSEPAHPDPAHGLYAADPSETGGGPTSPLQSQITQFEVLKRSDDPALRRRIMDVREVGHRVADALWEEIWYVDQARPAQVTP